MLDWSEPTTGTVVVTNLVKVHSRQGPFPTRANGRPAQAPLPPTTTRTARLLPDMCQHQTYTGSVAVISALAAKCSQLVCPEGVPACQTCVLVMLCPVSPGPRSWACSSVAIGMPATTQIG